MTKWVRLLLIANVVVFFLQASLGEGFTETFWLYPALIMVRPWMVFTLFTYMFLHAGFTHIAFNMLGLYVFGINVESRLGSTRFITLYLIGGIAGGLSSFVFARHSPVVGASAALYAVMIAYAVYWPHDRIM